MDHATKSVGRTMTRERKRKRHLRSKAGATSGNPFPPGLRGGRYQPLTREDELLIHQAALKVLERTGAEVFDSECRDILQQAGARVDKGQDRVFFPPELIEKTLKLADRNVVLYSQNGQHDLHLSDKRVHLGTGGAAIKVLDLDGRIRGSRLRDLYDIGRLVEGLDNIHFYLRPVVARDLSNDEIDINTFYACLAGTNKHVMGGIYFPGKVADVRQLGILIAGGEDRFLQRPFLSFNLGVVVSPLKFAPETIETLSAAVRGGIPVSLVTAPLSGATSPASLVGTIVQTVAEELAVLTYVNLLRPGHPALMGGMPLVADLRTGNMIGGCAELALMDAASAQMAQFYGLPIYNSSALTESKVPDVQAGFEKGLTTAVLALAGSEYIHHSAGMLESMLTVAYEQYVIDDDINGQAMRLVKGLEVNDETLSLDEIHDVVQGDGHYLGSDKTRSLMQTEYHYPHTADRATRTDWEAAGSLDMRATARLKARGILLRSFPSVIPKDVDAEIRDRFPIMLPRKCMLPGGYP